jgi:hypothetical protein
VLEISPKKEALHRDSNDGDEQSCPEDGQKEAPRFPKYGEPNVGPEHIVGAMGDVHNVHDPENEGKPACQEEEDSREGNTAEGLNDKKIQIHDWSPFRTNVELDLAFPRVSELPKHTPWPFQRSDSVLSPVSSHKVENLYQYSKKLSRKKGERKKMA